MPSLNDLQAAARELAPTTPANQPLRMLPEEARVLIDLRPALSDPAKRGQARALRKQLFNLVRQRLPLPQGVRLTVEVDDSSAPDYLVLKDADTGQWLYPTPAPAPASAPASSPASTARWYVVTNGEGDPAPCLDPIESALDVWWVSEDPVNDLDIPPVEGMTLTRVVRGSPVTYVALTDEQHEGADTDTADTGA